MSAVPARKAALPPDADLERLSTWAKHRNGLCESCMATCCTMPVEVRTSDLVRLGVLDAFDADGAMKPWLKRLQKSGVVERHSPATGLFTLARQAGGECVFLDRETRRCTVYERRPDTCRKHPQVGPRPGYCAFRLRVPAVPGDAPSPTSGR
ncbi:MAG: YkgJ family cysteine cluster protein [Burkholderiales bacterium]